ncbi:FCD domain-containing protein [uncultured Ferrovibrio sp.]|jgi:Transcriptional regulators|uniref:FadR/GntR family transcriptional regulator n=1 Tax=uncultured Ferrovibrio sp. TaxID=1576913 RepID=UPI002617A040|nr:FCD domain-containing protein [uncultured Ferrovibrio sp.]
MIESQSHSLLRPAGLGDALAGQLAAAIRGGEFRPGARLPTEKQLVERFHVSRAVVREAIARLKADGFVETRQGAGAFVAARPGLANFRIGQNGAAIPAEDLPHIFELRAVVEAGMAELAAQRRTPADLQALRAAFNEMEQALAGSGAKDGAAADDAFHAAIAAAAQNPYLAQFAAFLAQHFSASRAVTWMPDAIAAGSAQVSQAEHARLLAAIEAGDAQAAAQAARTHITQAAARHAARLTSKPKMPKPQRKG